jgi:hypothetical protein
MVWVLVVVLLVLVGPVISLDYCAELYNFVFNGQNKTDLGPVKIRILFRSLVVCIRKNT